MNRVTRYIDRRTALKYESPLINYSKVVYPPRPAIQPAKPIALSRPAGRPDLGHRIPKATTFPMDTPNYHFCSFLLLPSPPHQLRNTTETSKAARTIRRSSPSRSLSLDGRKESTANYAKDRQEIFQGPGDVVTHFRSPFVAKVEPS